MSERIKIGLEHLGLVTALRDVLNREANAVNQQVAIELLMASFAMRAGSIANAKIVIDGMSKHAKQIMESPR